jgi:hypothetical protein
MGLFPSNSQDAPAVTPPSPDVFVRLEAHAASIVHMAIVYKEYNNSQGAQVSAPEL